MDVNGRTVKTIDKDERTYTLTDENGNRTVYTYDQWDNLTHVAYPDGNEIAYQYDLNLQKVTRKIDENHIATRYIYDDQGRLTRRVEADGTSLQRTTEFGYDTDGYLTTIRRPGDTETAEALTTLTYDADGNMDTLTDPEALTTLTYDVMGNVLTKTDARDKVWTYTYDNTGRLRTITDPLDLVTEYVYDQAGNKIREIDPEGKETVFEYDARDNLKKAVNPALEEMLVDTTFDGRVLKQTDGEGRTSRYQYDTDGRLSATVDGNGNTIAMAYEGDASGCATCGSGSSGDQPTVIEFPTFTREIKYDGRGRKYAERDLYDDQILTTRYTYDSTGNLTTKTDAEGRVTSYLYDDLNRLIRVEDPEGNWTQYAYDKRDNLIALTDAEDQTTHFEYDRNNRLVKEIRPMGEETAYAYDGAGNLIEKIDAKNQRTVYGYDDAGRLVQIDYYADAADTAPAKTVTFTYDDAGNLTGYDDGTTSGAYAYDDADRKTTETVTYPGFDLSNTYAYYKNGLKQTYTGPDAITMGYLYDNNNQLTGVQIPNVGLFTVNEYQWNRPAEETLPGGGKRRYQYDPLMRVTNIEASDPGDNQQLNYAYTYDKVDNITAKQTEHGDYAYQYDGLYRLTDVDNPDHADEGFTYDGVGNRLTSAATTGDWTYNINNELEGYDATTFQYDANGNMIEKNVGGTITRFFYNLEDRLERVEDGSGTVIATYYYDPFGRRLWKDIGGTRTCFHYSDEGLVGEYDVAGTEIKTYGWKPGSTWSTDPLFMKQAGQYYWYHNDHLGTPQMMTTSSGAVVWKVTYSSFGKATVDPSSAVDNPLRFPGQYEDAETGLHYNWFRYYQTDIGRYLIPDPIGFYGGVNIFVYVSSNPMNIIDPFGLYDLWDFGEDSLAFLAGLGDAVTFGGSTWIAKQFMSDEDAAILNRTKQCSGAFSAGGWASLGLGAGRLLYAGAAKGGSIVFLRMGATMKNAASASAFRNLLKRIFRLNPWSKLRIYPFAKMVTKYGTPEAIIRAAGRTSLEWNLGGALAVAGGSTALHNR